MKSWGLFFNPHFDHDSIHTSQTCIKNSNLRWAVVVVYAFNPSVPEAEAGGSLV